jgi:ParB family chromosome partitioning protein
LKASELAGKGTMPCIVRELNDDEAIVAMVDSNLPRESILPSEKALAYKMKLEAMKWQAGRPSKENSTQVGQDLKGKYSVEILGEQVGESRNQIQRYIRLTELIPPILEMVDEKQIAFNPAVEISYLTEKEQTELLETMKQEENTPSLSQAQRLKKFSQEGRLSADVIYSILTEEKPNQKGKFNIRRDRIEQYFPKNYNEKQKEDHIVQLLESWYKKREREQER